MKARGPQDASHLLDGHVRVAAQVGDIATIVLVGKHESDVVPGLLERDLHGLLAPLELRGGRLEPGIHARLVRLDDEQDLLKLGPQPGSLVVSHDDSVGIFPRRAI